MNSLILKDLISLKNYSKTVVFIIIFFTIINFTNDQPSFLSGMIILIMSMLPITSFSYDQFAKWDLYSTSLPVSRKQIVASKYVLGLLTVFAGTIIATILNIVVSIIKSLPINMKDILIGNGIIACIGLLFIAILIPLIYKFGVEKSRLISIAVLALPSVAVIALSKSNVQLPNLDDVSPVVLLMVVMIVVTVIFISSLKIAVSIYSKKDF